MAGKAAAKKDKDTKLFAFLGVLFTVIGFIVVYATRKDDKYAMYYGKQGLVLFIAWVIVSVVGWIIGWVPVIGWLIMALLWLGMVLLWIFGMISSLSGEMKPIPIIGEFADKIKI